MHVAVLWRLWVRLLFSSRVLGAGDDAENSWVQKILGCGRGTMCACWRSSPISMVLRMRQISSENSTSHNTRRCVAGGYNARDWGVSWQPNVWWYALEVGRLESTTRISSGRSYSSSTAWWRILGQPALDLHRRKAEVQAVYEHEGPVTSDWCCRRKFSPLVDPEFHSTPTQ